MRWYVESERTIYRDRWLHLQGADVVLPNGVHLDHRVIRRPDAAFTVVVDRDRILLLWRHRFITNTWGWEIPGGAVEPGEEPVAAARRETAEETGWRPDGILQPLVRLQPMAGLLTVQHHVFRAEEASYLGPPVDFWEADRVVWVPRPEVRRLIAAGDIVEATTLAALLHLLTLG
ncbi:ADP-ribose pyrophosphatase YjhB, NUDIX family [Micromonospora phaseoli]|uniref:ADP-ribose pyrophosphatase YjhB, NUDIX family n=1 Tax=Micromonospora phaseoli TaxID=1144548 RepID=A0A1H7C6A4_9ACTN|nr:NUDIX hydrolase [Micromonospora phaseoli]PZV92768.1 ADP-ribose pyrophosphatase YjhB (NUDIX family) [Micromonospora phaseoli]GIJ76575.1 NUDIX hydrolase [Micromonospora phaseoli]SEJ82160.1 ADP-ribose pyrophosphatase YjhB, NUDIX family [Micromonospora phaseoli]